ncbi:unnamed protein product [Cylindrotheca closterium]|uniref:Uncharacterized protein n=1 Tax=Cylindrotheca closterium TaxID=2856 RepID=A0AAD2FZM7_9STRA|nr:unnamed protein product [Cylindrotheca closterium]
MGVSPMPNYEGTAVGEMDVAKKWDELDLSNRDEVKRYIHECGRLLMPVSNTHKVATEDISVHIGGKSVTFSKGTIIYIPMLLAGTDKNADVGGCPFQFDHSRKNVVDAPMIFHSAGNETNGRIYAQEKT